MMTDLPLKKFISPLHFFEPTNFFLFRRSILETPIFFQPENHVSFTFLSLKKKKRYVACPIFEKNLFLKKKKIGASSLAPLLGEINFFLEKK